MDAALQTTFLGVTLNNPFLLSSAPPSRSREMIERALPGFNRALEKARATIPTR